jgi:ribosomal protein L29
MVEVYGEQAVDQLTRDAQKVRKYSQAELEEMILALEKELA